MATPETREDLLMLRRSTIKMVKSLRHCYSDAKAEAIAKQIHQNYITIYDESMKRALTQRRLF